jgi:hypothetical protein
MFPVLSSSSTLFESCINSSHVVDAPALSDRSQADAPDSTPVDDPHSDAPSDSEALVASAENNAAVAQTINLLDADDPDSWSLV